ncbi:MAG: HPF/RaiA family ribosome-associated protein [Oleibacter sp.]|nr:HPF/RaiA family ribosome-associated protein [Thalassolituus sp.]
MKGLEISFRDMEHSDAIEHQIREKADRLTDLFDNITGIRAVVAIPHNHSQKGKIAHISLEVGIPGELIAITHDHHDKHEHENLYVALRDAFEKAQRKISKIQNKRIDSRRRVH